ncbi:hypothetical protein RFI_04250 [Reticulomyxa filosa]|uniref:Uncharacterized protein n=1 Tax=Reticulomyxa filosa TaxID=46433 RepID=X6P5K3_RETFI|nr:hypothetical protein RFI_04250 [Reticulomyxa filosa]|eukprot:ETO32867.1 hypothetical protein RFI_04250 [Reticulomyxa filosa]
MVTIDQKNYFFSIKMFSALNKRTYFLEKLHCISDKNICSRKFFFTNFLHFAFHKKSSTKRNNVAKPSKQKKFSARKGKKDNTVERKKVTKILNKKSKVRSHKHKVIMSCV